MKKHSLQALWEEFTLGDGDELVPDLPHLHLIYLAGAAAAGVRLCEHKVSPAELETEIEEEQNRAMSRSLGGQRWIEGNA